MGGITMTAHFYIKSMAQESRLGVKTLKSNSCIKKRISSLAEQILNNETGKQNFAHRDKREKSQSVALGFVLRGLAFSHSN